MGTTLHQGTTLSVQPIHSVHQSVNTAWIVYTSASVRFVQWDDRTSDPRQIRTCSTGGDGPLGLSLRDADVARRLVSMTLPGDELKPEVGVRELHDQLSRYVRHVGAGAEVVVTIRGRRIARLSSVESGDPMAELRARGLVRDPVAARRRATGCDRLATAGPVSDLVGEQRR